MLLQFIPTLFQLFALSDSMCVNVQNSGCFDGQYNCSSFPMSTLIGNVFQSSVFMTGKNNVVLTICNLKQKMYSARFANWITVS